MAFSTRGEKIIWKYFQILPVTTAIGTIYSLGNADIPNVLVIDQQNTDRTVAEKIAVKMLHGAHHLVNGMFFGFFWPIIVPLYIGDKVERFIDQERH